MAINILKKEKINIKIVYDALALVNPGLKTPIPLRNLTYNISQKESPKFNAKGLMILEALKKSSKGINTKPEDLYTSLLIFLQIEEMELAKSILVEYLINFSMLKIQN